MQIVINGTHYQVEEEISILQFCQMIGIQIPHLCWHPDLTPEARCRMCVVEVNGHVRAACHTSVCDDMVIETDSEKIREYRQLNLELLLESNHPFTGEEDNEVSQLAQKLDVELPSGSARSIGENNIDDSSPALIRDINRCILCGKCTQVCQFVQQVNAIGFSNRGHDMDICPVFGKSISEAGCVYCGQCANVCPTGAIREKDYVEDVKSALHDPSKMVIVQTAPAVRVSLGETQDLEPGQVMTGRMVSALRKLGFDKVLDTNFAADLTIMEEGTELIQRIQHKKALPLITSCCPGWIKFAEHYYPDLIPHLSTCKSPQQMFGAIVKSYYAQKIGKRPSDIVCVSIMPCTAKKFEITRPSMNVSGRQDVDYVLTTRELGRWLNDEHIDLKHLGDSPFDPVMGMSTGAAAIFGSTGGVMEAALRTVADLLEGIELPRLDYDDVRGAKGIKESSLFIGGQQIQVAIAHGLGNARILMDDLQKGTSDYHFIEIMACPGGCIGGGGQPKPTTQSTIKKRMEAIYNADRSLPIRKSHQNPEVQALYETYLGQPGSDKAHRLLHTRYINRKKALGESRI